MWQAVQRVPSRPLVAPDSGGRALVPSTPQEEVLGNGLPEEHAQEAWLGSDMARGTASHQEGVGSNDGQPRQVPNGSSRGSSSSTQGASGNVTPAGGARERPTQNGSSGGGNNSSGNGGDGGSGDGSDGDGGGRANGGSDEPLEPEELPQVDVQMVPLGTAVGRLITYAYTELVTLVDTLPNRAEADRRAEILRYTEHVSDLLTKLLVLVRWAKHAPQIQKCQNVIAYLDSQNRYFEYAVDSIYATYLSMPNVRMRNYDVGNAIDILTTGSYQRLPVAIKRAVPPPKLTRAQIRTTLHAIDGIICSRILRGEAIPSAMRRYKIADGRIAFTVPGEFEATLTLLQYGSEIPWHIVGVKILVAGAAVLPGEQQVTVNTWKIIDRAQYILIEASAAASQEQESPTDGVPPDAGSTPAIRPSPQLAQLYDFLHHQCLTVLLEVVFKQAVVLLRARWENLLHAEMSGDRSALVLRYWTSGKAAAAASQGGSGDRGNSVVVRLCGLPVPRPIHAAASESESTPSALPPSETDGEFQRIEHERRSLIPKRGLSITWTASSGLGAPRTWTRTVSHARELAESADDCDIVLASDGVDTERLLQQVAWRHAHAILDSLHASMTESRLFSSSAVEFLYVSPAGAAKKELGLDEADRRATIPVLRAWYRQDEGAVDLTVDMYTGRLVVRASEVAATGTSLSESMISQFAEQLNRTPWRIAALMVGMRSSLALADLDCLVPRSLGLRLQTAPNQSAPVLPGFVQTGVIQRAEAAGGPPTHASAAAAHLASSAPGLKAGGTGTISPAMPGTPFGFQQQQQQQPSSMPAAASASGFPLRVSQQEADALLREVAGADNPLGRVRFYMIEGTEGAGDQVGPPGTGTAGEWYLMVAMTDRLQFRLVLLTPHTTDRLQFVVSQIVTLQVDRLFSSIARRLFVERRLDRSALGRGDADGCDAHAGGPVASEHEITEKVDAMLSGRTSITLDYLNALASTCRARLALRLLQTQLTRWKIPYSFRLPSFSTSPHGHRAAVSKELSVVGLDRMGLYELDEQVPILYVPIVGLMRASPINWSVANQGVLPDETRRMVSIRIASDELDPSLRADLSSSTRVDQRRQAALAEMEGRAKPSGPHARPGRAPACNPVTAGSMAAAGGSAGHSLIGRHVIPCQVIASIPIALDRLPAPVASAYADAVNLGAHAAADGGYHAKGGDETGGGARSGYSKVVLVYRQVSRALQCLIRDWSEQHLMTHVARYMYVWEQRELRRLLASTTAYYPFNAGPYTGAMASMLGSWRGHQSAELVIQVIGSCFVSVSCRAPFPFASDDTDGSRYPLGYSDSGGNDLSFHLTLADVDPQTNRIVTIASTWPWVFARNSTPGRDTAAGDQGRSRGYSGLRSAGFEVSASLSRWLRTLQAQLNLTGNPLVTLSMIMQLMPIHHIISSLSAAGNIRTLLPSLQFDSRESLIHFRVKHLLAGDDAGGAALREAEGAGGERNAGAAAGPPGEEDHSHVTLHKLSTMPKDVSQAFAAVNDLHIVHMYTAVDTIRLVFNSRYIVDMRLVSTDIFHVSDAVESARTLVRQSYSTGSVAPKPLVTSTAEPIPLFADWLEAMAREMKFDWGMIEEGVSAIFHDVMPPEAISGAQLDARERVRLFQQNMHRLRPGASKAEWFLHRWRKMIERQSSTQSPMLLPLPPAAMMCTRLHLVPVLRSLMRWLVQSVHVRDQLEMAIARTQEIVSGGGESGGNGGSSDLSQLKEPLFGVNEKLVFMSNREADNKQTMIVGFTGARGSVRCEFLMKAGVADSRNEQAPAAEAKQDAAAENNRHGVDMDVDDSQATARSGGPNGGAKAEPENDFESAIRSLMSDSFVIPEGLMRVDLDVRIVTLTHPPSGISEAAATHLVGAFNSQPAGIRQRAGTLVRLLALPPQLLMDVVDISRKLRDKVEVCALAEGVEHLIRLDAVQSQVVFWMRVRGPSGEWTRLALRYALLTGEAHVASVADKDGQDQTAQAAASQWADLAAGVIAALNQQAVFTRDMGKNGKSRWFDIVQRLYEAHQQAQPQPLAWQ